MRPQHTLSLAIVRRRSRLWLGAVLPALVLRALIPFGFMPVAGHAGLAMELCPGAAAMATGGHHHHGAPAADSAHALCIFAAGAAPALVPVVIDSPLTACCAATAPEAREAVLRLPSIQRAQSARAPPSSV
ncbi:MAG: hypothetical protein JSR36_10685 [Proteobacteria bacterium]|nr:hypothetical protein [Pseudomonadota bacterium]